jgi:hypothetical protein
MAHALKASDVEALETTALRAKSALQKFKAKAEEQSMKLIETGEILTSAFAFGLIDGRWGGIEFLGMPLPLIGAIGFHLIGFGGIASDHMHALGNGAGAAYFNGLGQGLGAKMAMEAQKALVAPKT